MTDDTTSATSTSPTSVTAPAPAPVSSPASPTTASAPPPAPVPVEQPRQDSKPSTPPTKAQIAAAVKTAQSNAESSKSMDEQVKTQGVVIGAMGYVQGFDAYNVALKDVPFYRPYSIYGNQKTIDNRRASRGLFGASDSRHDEMVQSQYR